MPDTTSDALSRESLKAIYDYIDRRLTGGGINAYPVGSIYMSVIETSPADIFGGTWEALDQGRVLIGAGSVHPAGETGGAETVALTAAQMPSHNHSASFSGSSGSSGSHSHSISGSLSSGGSHSHECSGLSISGKLNSVAFDPYMTISASGAFSISSEKSYWNATGTNKKIISTRDVTLSGSLSGSTASGGSHSHSFSSVSASSAGSHTHSISGTVTIGSTGSGQAHENMPPYLSVYMWKRTA